MLSFRVENSLFSAAVLTGIGLSTASCRINCSQELPCPLKCTTFGRCSFKYWSKSSARTAHSVTRLSALGYSLARIFSRMARHSLSSASFVMPSGLAAKNRIVARIGISWAGGSGIFRKKQTSVTASNAIFTAARSASEQSASESQDSIPPPGRVRCFCR
jgi:hypothetical protein